MLKFFQPKTTRAYILLTAQMASSVTAEGGTPLSFSAAHGHWHDYLSHGSRLHINHDASGALAAVAKLRDTVATIVDDGL